MTDKARLKRSHNFIVNNCSSKVIHCKEYKSFSQSNDMEQFLKHEYYETRNIFKMFFYDISNLKCLQGALLKGSNPLSYAKEINIEIKQFNPGRMAPHPFIASNRRYNYGVPTKRYFYHQTWTFRLKNKVNGR